MTSHTAARRSSVNWAVVLACCLIYNVSYGFAIGSFAVAMPFLERDLGISRAVASTALAVMLIAVSLLSWVVGVMTTRLPFRAIMLLGVLLCALGSIGLAFVTRVDLLLLFYGLLGAGATCLGPVAISALITRCINERRGLAISIAFIPLFQIIAPVLAARLIEHGGLRLMYLALAGSFGLLVPLIFAIREPEAHETTGGTSRPGNIEVAVSFRLLFTSLDFWLLSLSIGMLTMGAVGFSAHGVAIALHTGIGVEKASLVGTAVGVGGLLGAFFFGRLMDRIGAFRASIISAILAAMVWLSVLVAPTLPMLVAMAAVLGGSTCGISALHAMGMASIVSARDVGRAMGYSYLIKTPFLFMASALAGFIFDRDKSYNNVAIVYGLILVVAVAGFAAVMKRHGSLSAHPSA